MRTTSTSFMTGTGLKKWSPAKRSARCVAADISVIVSDDVFEQKIVDSGLQIRSSVPERLLLDVQVLDDRLDDEVAVRQVLQARRRREPPVARRPARSAASFFFSTALAREDPSIRWRPLAASSSETSRTTVS